MAILDPYLFLIMVIIAAFIGALMAIGRPEDKEPDFKSKLQRILKENQKQYEK